MDKVHAYIKESVVFYKKTDQRELLKDMSLQAGLFWMNEGLEPWERDVHWPELELLSAFEFLRQELPADQRDLLDEWIAKYAGWREQGIFYRNYREAWGGKFTWKEERTGIENLLGRIIPRDHWWLWPDEI